MEEERKKPRTSNEVNNRYHKKAFKRYNLAFHKVNDCDVIEKLDNVENKNDYIRQLVREDLENNPQ